jgi:branched-chain amino acid transport system permease protein
MPDLRSALPARLAPAGTLALVLAAACLAFLVSDYSLFQLSRVLTIAMAVLAINLLTGYTGQISVGHGALFGIGAYATAILVVKADLPYGLALLCATGACFACGLALGVPALRIRGMYLGLLTLGLAVTLPPLLKRFPDVTGGVYGLTVQTPHAPFGLGLTPAQWVFLLSLAVLAGAMLLVRNLTRGRTGRSLDALRTSELLAVANGVRVGRTKILVFAISAGMAGLGGGLFQLVIGATTPDSFAVLLSLSMLTAAVLGGLRSRLGAVLGAAFVVYVPDQAASLGDSAPQYLYAGALLLVIYVLPGGIASLPRRAVGLLARSRSRPAAVPAAPAAPSGTS